MSVNTPYSDKKSINQLDKGSYNDYGDGTPAKQVLAHLTGQDAPIEVVVVDQSKMTCEKGVFNLIAGIPLEITPVNINEICDATFYKDDGSRIFISYKNLTTKIEVCSNKTLANLEYRLEGLDTSSC